MPIATPLIPPPIRELTFSDARRLVFGRQLGRGSVATVYRGIVETGFKVKRAVAIKLYDAVVSDEQEIAVEVLATAARNAACVRHPNVVQVYDFGSIGSQPFVVMELVEGKALSTLIEAYRNKRQRMPLDLALFIGIEMSEALNGARLATTPEGTQLGLAHGELSSTDAMLSWNGEVKVTDFGVANATRAASSVRSVRSLAGRIRSLAPEVARGGVGDARSDVFSLGVLLREMLVGPRFNRKLTESETLASVRDGVVHSAVFEPQLPRDIQTILRRSLERDPARRFPHAGALAYELRRVALAMGVGDGRTFLRHTLPQVCAPEGDDEVTHEVQMPKVQDRFKRLRGSDPDATQKCAPPAPESGTMRKGAIADDD
jgi:serine/threonine-protein kinase